MSKLFGGASAPLTARQKQQATKAPPPSSTSLRSLERMMASLSKWLGGRARRGYTVGPVDVMPITPGGWSAAGRVTFHTIPARS